MKKDKNGKGITILEIMEKILHDIVKRPITFRDENGNDVSPILLNDRTEEIINLLIEKKDLCEEIDFLLGQISEYRHINFMHMCGIELFSTIPDKGKVGVYIDKNAGGKDFLLDIYKEGNKKPVRRIPFNLLNAFLVRDIKMWVNSYLGTEL